MRRPVVVMTWLTLTTRVCGVSAAARRSTMRPGSWSVVAISMRSMATPCRRATWRQPRLPPSCSWSVVSTRSPDIQRIPVATLFIASVVLRVSEQFVGGAAKERGRLFAHDVGGAMGGAVAVDHADRVGFELPPRFDRPIQDRARRRSDRAGVQVDQAGLEQEVRARSAAAAATPVADGVSAPTVTRPMASRKRRRSAVGWGRFSGSGTVLLYRASPAVRTRACRSHGAGRRITPS